MESGDAAPLVLRDDDGPHAAAGILGTWERTADGILLLDAGAAAALATVSEGSGAGAASRDAVGCGASASSGAEAVLAG